MPNIADARRTYPVTLGFVATREELPFVLNERGLLGCGVEVGVKEGKFSAHLLSAWRGCHLISIDPWLTDAADAYRDVANVDQESHDGYYEETVGRLTPFGERSTIWRETSLEGSRRIAHHSLDFVYLDARHDFNSVLEDLEAWYDKVRPGGILAGHDYIDGEFLAGVFGVRSAVDVFFAARGIAVHATMLDEPCISWMVEIPQPESRPALVLADPEPVASPVQKGESEAAAATSATAPDRALPLSGELRSATLKFASATGPQEVVLHLDPKQMSQSIMLDCFDNNQLYEPETSQLLATILRPGDTFVDVGAHVGYFSMLAGALVGPEGRVVSFEPEARNFRQLLDHIEINALAHVTAVNAAVAQEDGVADFHVNSDNDGGHALWDVGMHDYNQQSRDTPLTRQIDVVSVDQFLRDNAIAPPRVIKIDAEGAEHAVLLGASETLRQQPAAFIIAEINHFGLERMGTSERAIRQTMTGLGYETYAFEPEAQRIVRLGDDQYIQSDYVFNLVFRHPAAA